MRKTTHLGTFFLLCLVLTLTVGCGESGPELGRVSGTVTLGGKPLPNANVEFQPGAGGAPSYGKTDEEGLYELTFSVDRDGALVGTHTVRISTFREYRETDEGPILTVPERVPPKYNEQSELTREVKSGRNELNFDLEAK